MKAFARLILSFLICFYSLAGVTQERISFPTKKIQYKVYRTFVDSLSIEEVHSAPHLFTITGKPTGKGHPNEIFWVQLDFINDIDTLQTQDNWIIRHVSLDYAELYYSDSNSFQKKDFGNITAPTLRNSLWRRNGVSFTPETLIENRYLYVKAKRVILFEDFKGWYFSFTSDEEQRKLKNLYDWHDLNRFIPRYIFAGFCLIMLFLTLAIFLRSGRKEFIFYGFYLFALFVCLSGSAVQLFSILASNFLVHHWIYQLSQILINLFYLLFVVHYLETETTYPKLHSWIIGMVVLLCGIIVLQALFLFSKYWVGYIYISDFQRLVSALFALAGMVYLLIVRKEKMSLFVIVGSFFYLVGAVGWNLTASRLLMIIGSSLEIFLFALGLSYKVQQEYRAKIHFQQMAAKSASKLLRTQISPHFIFNALGSIQNLILTRKKDSALRYLSKFSSLLRGLLENSLETVSLAEEVKLLNEYLELEALRFEDAFDYTVHVSENIDQHAEDVPVLLVQPFVENAIVHGLLPKKEGDKELAVNFFKKGSEIICEIDDNGIGRSASKSRGKINIRKSLSRGIEISRRRLQNLPSYSEDAVQIIDKFDDQGRPGGTKVIIRICTE